MAENMTSTSSYRIEFDGNIQKGQELGEVKTRLCELFRTEDRGKIDGLFRNTPKTLKKNLSEEQAQKYQRAFEQTGACCRIIQEEPDARTTAPSTVQAPPCSTTKALSADTRKKSGSSPGIQGIIASVVILSAGLFFLALIGMEFWNEVRTYTNYQEGVCTIVSKQILEYDNDGKRYEPSFEFHVRTNEGEQLSSASGYVANSESFDSRSEVDAILETFELEEGYGCWYDPEDPSEAVLIRKLSLKELSFAALPLLFVFIGGAMALAGIRSIWKDARQRGMSGESKIVADNAPAAPSPSSNFRQTFVHLRSEKQHFAEPIMASGLALLLNGLGLYFMIAIVRAAIQGKFFFSSTFYAVFFMGGGYFATRWAFRKWATLSRASKTALDVYGGALVPGQEVALRIHHSGQDRIRTFRVVLKGFEKITYKKGTDTINEEWLMHDQSVMELENLSLSSHKPLQEACTICLPPDAMHSFKSEHNEIAWSFVVSITPEGGSEVKKVFPVQVALV